MGVACGGSIGVSPVRHTKRRKPFFSGISIVLWRGGQVKTSGRAVIKRPTATRAKGKVVVDRTIPSRGFPSHIGGLPACERSPPHAAKFQADNAAGAALAERKDVKQRGSSQSFIRGIP